MRESLIPLTGRKRTTTGQELVELFLRSPLAGPGIEIERDRSTGRPIDFE